MLLNRSAGEAFPPPASPFLSDVGLPVLMMRTDVVTACSGGFDRNPARLRPGYTVLQGPTIACAREDAHALDALRKSVDLDSKGRNFMLRLCPFVVKEENANNLSPRWQGLAHRVPVHLFCSCENALQTLDLLRNSAAFDRKF